MNATRTLDIPLRARLVSESEVSALVERQRRVREETRPKDGRWVDEELKEEKAA